MNEKFSQLPSGGTTDSVTDQLITLRDGTTVYLTRPPALQAIPITLSNGQAVAGVQAGQLTPQSPTIQSISQSSGYLSGNQPLVIQGYGFLSTTSVTFGAQSVQWFYARDTQIICMPPPASTAGAVTVTVTTASGPSANTTPATTAFTYTAATIAGTQTPLFRQAPPVNGTFGTYSTSQPSLGLDQKMWFTNPLLTGSQPGFTASPATIVLNFNTSGSPLLTTIANDNSSTLTVQSVYQYGSTLVHSVKSVVCAGDGRMWGYDHHGNIIAHNSQNNGTEAYSVNVYPLKQTGDSDPGGVPSVILASGGYLVLAGNLMDGSAGCIWRVNPFNPLDQIKRIYPGLSFGTGCVGKNGHLFLTDFTGVGIAEFDTNLNQVGTTTPVAAGSPNQLCLGNDLNLWLTTAGSPPKIVKILSSDLTNQTVTNLTGCSVAISICAGSDDNIWIAGSNKFITKVDSVVFQISTANASILNTYTLAGSVGGSPSSHAGGCAGIGVDAQGGICVTVDQDPSASPLVSGYVVRLT